MIAKIGSFAAQPRARRKPVYTCRSTKKRRLPIGSIPQAQLPTATLAGRGARYEFGSWVRDKLAWVKPRTIPLVVAFVGLIAGLAAVQHLSSPEGWSTAVIQLDQAPRSSIEVRVGPPGATVHVDSTARARPLDLQLTPVRVRL
jgi:hypothetical protein